MDLKGLYESIRGGESDGLEFKGEARDLRAVGRAVCAFANSSGGMVVVGVDDRGGIVGVDEDPDRLQERLTSFLHTGLSTPVSARCGRLETPAGWVHWIRVPRQRGFEPMRHRGRYWVRRGRSSVEPSPSELQELFNVFGFVGVDPLLRVARGIQGPLPPQRPAGARGRALRGAGERGRAPGVLHHRLAGIAGRVARPGAGDQSGALPNQRTVESVRAGGWPRSRNELMVNAMVVARLMERRGRGWLLMREAMAEFDLPEPKIENDPVGRTVRVTLRRAP